VAQAEKVAQSGAFSSSGFRGASSCLWKVGARKRCLDLREAYAKLRGACDLKWVWCLQAMEFGEELARRAKRISPGTVVFRDSRSADLAGLYALAETALPTQRPMGFGCE
jgi:hypothetical protein